MPLPLRQACAELSINQATLRRWVRAGAPVSQRGGRGRGRKSLYDPAAIAAWRNSSASPAASYCVLASELPELVADACYEAFKAIQGPHKRACADALAGAWFVITASLLDRLRVDDAAIQELSSLPEKVRTLRAIFSQSASLGSVTPNSRG